MLQGFERQKYSTCKICCTDVKGKDILQGKICCLDVKGKDILRAEVLDI